MFFGEQPDGSVIEIESRDVDFLKENFPSKGDVRRELELYEMGDPVECAPSHLVENGEEILLPPGG